MSVTVTSVVGSQQADVIEVEVMQTSYGTASTSQAMCAIWVDVGAAWALMRLAQLATRL